MAFFTIAAEALIILSGKENTKWKAFISGFNEEQKIAEKRARKAKTNQLGLPSTRGPAVVKEEMEMEMKQFREKAGVSPTKKIEKGASPLYLYVLGAIEKIRAGAL